MKKYFFCFGLCVSFFSLCSYAQSPTLKPGVKPSVAPPLPAPAETLKSASAYNKEFKPVVQAVLKDSVIDASQRDSEPQ